MPDDPLAGLRGAFTGRICAVHGVKTLAEVPRDSDIADWHGISVNTTYAEAQRVLDCLNALAGEVPAYNRTRALEDALAEAQVVTLARQQAGMMSITLLLPADAALILDRALPLSETAP